MKKIKLAIIALEENYLERLANRLRGEKDITLLQTIIIKDYEIDMKQFIAFVELMIKQPPDILLFDQATLRDSAALDLEGILDYRDKLQPTKVIVVGEHYIGENVIAMIQGGVQGFFRKALGDEQLIKCIRVVARGEIWFDAVLITQVLDQFNKELRKNKDQFKSLTHLNLAKLEMLSPREMEVLALISQSMTNEEIAERLFLSPKTVKTHLRNIFSKSGIRNRVEAALLYTRHTQISH